MAAPTKSALLPQFVRRRCVLEAACALVLTRTTSVLADEAADAAAPPRDNDLLVYAFGDRQNVVIAPEDISPGAAQTFAYPMDPQSRVIRNGTRLNQVLLVRLPPERLAEQTRARSAAGIVAYSGVCTHTGCDVTDWHEQARRFKCPCHESEFDPSDAARVVGGPAPWQLAALPLKIADGVLAVAGSFEGRVGFAQPGFEPFGP
jgi:Rieske Fe-S protein